MENEMQRGSGQVSPFERIRRTNESGMEYWSSRDFALVLGYNDYRNFETVVEKAKLACLNSGQRVADHFGDVTEMVQIGSGAERTVKTVLMSRYACYLAIQNADPKKENLRRTYSGPRRPRRNCAARESVAYPPPIGHTMKLGPRSGKPLRNWAAPCPKLYRYRKPALSKSRPLKRSSKKIIKNHEEKAR